MVDNLAVQVDEDLPRHAVGVAVGCLTFRREGRGGERRRGKRRGGERRGGERRGGKRRGGEGRGGEGRGGEGRGGEGSSKLSVYYLQPSVNIDGSYSVQQRLVHFLEVAIVKPEGQ